jgi:hypothetical protein
MSAHFVYFLAIVAVALAVSVVFLWRWTRRSFNEYAHAAGRETPRPFDWDAITSEPIARIFNPEDSDFVTRETSRQIARSFRRERAALALQWLLEVRRHVSLLMQTHRRLARSNPSLTPSGELRLGFEFLLFQVTSGILYLVIWLFGPLHAATLVRHPLELAGQLRKMAEDIMPGDTQVAVEFLESEPQTKNRTASM